MNPIRIVIEIVNLKFIIVKKVKKIINKVIFV